MISASVGNLGANDPDDVRIVQCALNVWRTGQRKPPIAVDGLVGPQTIAAISDFQTQKRLVTDGRIDAGGATIKSLREAIGSEAAVFGPVIAKLLFIQSELTRISIGSRSDVATFAGKIAARLSVLRPYEDLAEGFDPSPPFAVNSFRQDRNAVGFVGVDDATVATIVFAFFVAAMLILIVSSPAFRKAVDVRAKELDRILKQLGVGMKVNFEEAISLIVSIADETIDAANKCRNSPTFNPSPECADAIRMFKLVADRIRNQLFDNHFRLLLNLFQQGKGGRFDVREIRRQIEVILSRMRQNAIDLQVELQNMRDKCNCPEV
jgi:peptidoglycan hydrolase-like protein with peptidoglycan-binding domain